MLCIERVAKPCVIKAQQQAAIFGFFRIDLVDAGDFFCNVVQNGLETPGMFPLHKLHDIAKVVSMDIQNRSDDPLGYLSRQGLCHCPT